MAFSNRGQLAMLATDLDGAREWNGRAIALAEELGEEEIIMHALTNLGCAEFEAELPGGMEKLQRSLAMAEAAGYVEHVARAYCNLVAASIKQKRHAEVAPLVEDGLAYCADGDLDSWSRYILAWRAVGELNAGHYEAAIATASDMLSNPNVATISKIPALTAMGLAYARIGDERYETALAEALRARAADPRAAARRAGRRGDGGSRLADRRRRRLARRHRPGVGPRHGAPGELVHGALGCPYEAASRPPTSTRSSGSGRVPRSPGFAAAARGRPRAGTRPG